MVKKKSQKRKQPKQKPKPKPTKENKSSNPPPPKPQIPTVVQIELTPRAYEYIKQELLKRQNPLVRGHVNTYFEWLKSIKPEDIIVGIETGRTLKDAYKEAPYRWRLAVAMARGFLKASEKYAEQFRQIVRLDLALLTLKYENPEAYAVIERYGQKGINYLEQCLKDALEIFGVTGEQKA